MVLDGRAHASHSLHLLRSMADGKGGKESACQCRSRKGCGFDPWIGKIPWRRKWQPTAVFLAWKIPQTEEPGGLQSMGLQRAGHD